MTKEFTGKLERIDDNRWRVPKSYSAGMRVPGIIYADAKLLPDIINDNAVEQVANGAHLPGIARASMAMPDIHWGYGLPIGGVVATDVAAGGVVTPGGVGFDINCLCGKTRILLDNSAYVRIEDFENIFSDKQLSCMDFGRKLKEGTLIKNFIKIRPSNRVLEVTTLSGDKITATEDHPFWTPDGMIPLKDLGTGDVTAIYPLEGVPHEIPSDEIIIDENDVKRFLLSIGKDSRGNGLEQIISHLKARGLLPLRYSSPQLQYLLKIMGYNFGDGHIFFNRKRGKGCVSFYGQDEDLKEIARDIRKIGFLCSKVYSRVRDHAIDTMYSKVKFTSENFSCKVGASGFAALLVVLGTPLGNKTTQNFRVPAWIRKAPLWQKRIFLAGFFGAEMSSPATLTGHGCNFYCPTISMNKQKGFIRGGKEYLMDLSDLLKEFGVSSKKISQREEYIKKDGNRSDRLRLMMSGDTENLINLYSKIGFEYNKKRSALSNAAVQYLKMKKDIVKERYRAEYRVKELAGVGLSAGAIHEKLNSPFVNKRFVERSLCEGRKGSPRVGVGMIAFYEFLEYRTRGLGMSGMVWDRIESIREIDFDGYVYDFTVAHSDHNFIANNFIVSNCGVRLVRTDLTERDVKPRIKELVDTLFTTVPTGVGSTGDVKIGRKEEEKIFTGGAKWAVDSGYGWEEDIEYAEENGAIEGADPEKVSSRAYERGRDQSGTLGSGNHFIELQVVDEIFDPGIAEVFGITKGQITVMVHTGSRGLGHQVCTDYSARMVGLMDKYGIRMPDRQLACVPVESAEGKDYLAAMRCAANYAWANRQVITHLARKSFEKVFGEKAERLGLGLVYDVAHNIAKFEKYVIGGEEKLLCVHRKGATRALPAGHKDIPEKYRSVGQPVLIPGDMGRCSYLLVGRPGAEETFYSTCHGAGRVMSRKAAVQRTRGRSIKRELEDKGIMVRSSGRETLGEEVPEAYKNVTDVVDVVQAAGLSDKVAKMRPIGVIKG